jgi:hypothetical protein
VSRRFVTGGNRSRHGWDQKANGPQASGTTGYGLICGLINIEYKKINDFNVHWRMGRDSNPRWARTHAGFQDRCLKPLGHPSLAIKSSIWLSAPREQSGERTVNWHPIGTGRSRSRVACFTSCAARQRCLEHLGRRGFDLVEQCQWMLRVGVAHASADTARQIETDASISPAPSQTGWWGRRPVGLGGIRLVKAKRHPRLQQPATVLAQHSYSVGRKTARLQDLVLAP